jgi:hypothetical protein
VGTTNGPVNSILRARRLTAAILSVTVVTAVLFCRGPHSADAGGLSVREQTRIAIAENALVTADILLFTTAPNMVGMTKKTDDVAKKEADAKHTNYVKDHISLLALTRVPPLRTTNDYIDQKSGDLSFKPAGPTTATIFSEAYKDRAVKFQAGALVVLEGNNHAASDIKTSQGKISYLKTASDGIQDSYISQIQSGGQVSTFLSQELYKLRVDISRQIAAETRFTINERQEREDELLAFEQAVKSWTNSGRAGAGY